MKTTYHYICTLLIASAAMVLGSCSEEDTYERAPQVADGVATAYFAASNSHDAVISPEDYAAQPADTVTVYRHNTTGQATVPVVVDYADAVFQIPESVTFADGDSVAKMVVGLNGLDMYKEYKYSVHLDDAYTNPYAMTEGSTKFNYKVMVSRWEKYVENARIVLNANEIPETYSDIYHLEGVNRFYIENFLGSGINVMFKINCEDDNGVFSYDNFNSNDFYTWKGNIVPLSNYYMDYDSDYDYSYWWLLTDANEYASWSIDGHAHGGVSYINFPVKETDDSYGGINMLGSYAPNVSSGDAYAAWSQAYIYYADGETSGWTYYYIYFDTTNMPADIYEKYSKLHDSTSD